MAFTQLLLLEDIRSLGRKGEIVKVRSGYAWNFLLPKKLGLVADKGAVQKQKKLQEERAKQAVQDKKDAEILAEKMRPLVIETKVKVDPAGKPYGSVTTTDILHLVSEQHAILIEKKNVAIKQPIKAIGEHTIPVRLNEGVETTMRLLVVAEGGNRGKTIEVEKTEEEK